MGRFALCPIFLPTTLWVDGWRPLDGTEVQTAIEGQKLVYENGARQEFRATVRTIYNAGEDSRGLLGGSRRAILQHVAAIGSLGLL